MPHPKDILRALDAAPLKSLSQNFLTSPHWAEKLVTAALKESNAHEIWEIGPGLGALTEVLARSTSKAITLFEYDRKLSVRLRELYPTLRFIEGDVLDASFTELCHSTTSKSGKITFLSNLPYHLSSPLLFKLTEIRTHIERLVFTFQREFAQRIKAHVGDELYGSLSLLIQLQYDIRSLGILPPSVFYPVPTIDSEALVLTPNKRTAEEVGIASPVVKAAFLHPRKKMVNNLKLVFPEINWALKIDALGKTQNVRAEELALEDFLILCKR